MLAALLVPSACADAAPPRDEARSESAPTAGRGATPSVDPVESEEVRTVDLIGVLAQGGFARGQVRGGAFNGVFLNGEQIPTLEDGRFFIAFGRDAELEAQLAVEYADGDTFAQTFALADTSFPESSLPAATTTGIESDPAFERRRADELAQIRAARAEPSGLTGWTEPFIKPVPGNLTSRFGAQRFYGEVARSPHSGADYDGAVGTPVIAPASGTVVLAGEGYSYEGGLVILDHGLGLYSAFLHLSAVDVSVGYTLDQGDPIGELGATGRATGPHLHWGLWWQGVRFDPQALLARQ
jgi:murein DD-endopeptidase MepM/ murein hydrolase activator NlpD